MTIVNWLQPLAGIILAPLLIGLINRIKALFAGRHGVPLFQLYYDVFKLIRKGSVYSRTTSTLYRITPAIVISSVIAALSMIPWGNLAAPVSFQGNFLLFIYLLGLARFMTVLAALDTGSSFEGMGASREVFFAALVEPSLLIGFLVTVIQSGSYNLSYIFTAPYGSISIPGPAPLLLIGCSWLIVLLTENSRIPVDDPNTHLELTMIHEVMILDYSGPDLGYIMYASAIKLWIFSALLVNLLIPFPILDIKFHIPVFILGIITVTVVVGIIESIMARIRFRQIPKMIIGSFALGTVALILIILGGNA